MTKISNFFILIILIICLIIFLYIIKNFNNYESYENFSNSENESQYSYYRCNEKTLSGIIKKVFDNNNIVQSNDDWNIYMPCGYNNIEQELKNILIKNKLKNKYIFGLNGCDTMVSKNKIWESLVKCYGRKYSSTLMPESYVLDDPNEMEIFRKNYNPSKNEIYILKKNIQRKEGLKLTKDYFEIIEGSTDNYKVAQKYITELYLINDRKVNLRIYLLIVIKNNIIYFYTSKKGKCIYTNKKYNHNDLDFESNITSYNLDMNIYKENPRNFEELKAYIDAKTVINQNIYDNLETNSGDYLFNKIDILMKEISVCLSKIFFQSKNISETITFQLFGADVIFDKNLHPYLLEMNKGPDMSARDTIDEKMKLSVQSDVFKTIGIIKNNEENSFYLIYKSKII